MQCSTHRRFLPHLLLLAPPAGPSPSPTLAGAATLPPPPISPSIASGCSAWQSSPTRFLPIEVDLARAPPLSLSLSPCGLIPKLRSHSNGDGRFERRRHGWPKRCMCVRRCSMRGSGVWMTAVKKRVREQGDENLQYNYKCSFLEIYSERIAYLLSPSSTILHSGRIQRMESKQNLIEQYSYALGSFGPSACPNNAYDILNSLMDTKEVFRLSTRTTISLSNGSADFSLMISSVYCCSRKTRF